MRFHLLLISSIAALSSLSVAQIDVYPGRTSFTSRGSLSKGAGETLQGLHASHWRGIGDTGKACEIKSLNVITQDQKGSTQETFWWVFRKGTDAAGPTTGKAGEVAVLGPLKTPSTTRTTPVAWSLTSNLTTAVAISCTGHNSFGLRLSAAPAWTSDGQSTHASAQVFNNVKYQHSHANAGDHAWQIVGAATTASHPSLKRSWRYRLQSVSAPTLQIGNTVPPSTTPKNGMGGMYPDTAATTAQGLVASISDSGNKSGFSVLLASPGRVPGLPVFPGTARAYISPVGLLVVGGVSLSTSGSGRVTIVPKIPAGLKGTVYFQALNWTGKFTNITMSNSHATTFL